MRCHLFGCFLCLSLLLSSGQLRGCSVCLFWRGLRLPLRFWSWGYSAEVGRKDFLGWKWSPFAELVWAEQCWRFCRLSGRWLVCCWRRQQLSCFSSRIGISWRHQVYQPFPFWRVDLLRTQLWEGGIPSWPVSSNCALDLPKTLVCRRQQQCRPNFPSIICIPSCGNHCYWGRPRPPQL